MSDEAVSSVPGLPALQYTLKHYLLYLRQVQERATALNGGEGTVGGLGGYPELPSEWSLQSCLAGQGGQCPGPQTPSVPP